MGRALCERLRRRAGRLGESDGSIMLASPDAEVLEEARDRDGVELCEAMSFDKTREVKGGREPCGAVMQCDYAAQGLSRCLAGVE